MIVTTIENILGKEIAVNRLPTVTPSLNEDYNILNIDGVKIETHKSWEPSYIQLNETLLNLFVAQEIQKESIEKLAKACLKSPSIFIRQYGEHIKQYTGPLFRFKYYHKDYVQEHFPEITPDDQFYTAYFLGLKRFIPAYAWKFVDQIVF